MKKLLILAALFISFSSFSYAINVNQKILNSFKKDFSTAINVQWKALEETVYQAEFSYNGELFNAYYNEDGELIGSARFINKGNMPLLISKSLQEKYGNFLIRTAIEYNNGNETSYFITMVSQCKSVIVQASPSGSLSVVKKFKTY
ncbi:hypothetical protein [Pinibacter soli]|uniref:Beta-lactamase-inhibitor-like PepSY-like domain-containing protein n=1 Tax=Pinibacter soli TaxID=3044211 RepID=A0ABT6R861_9BACT|nr:hypothetical protein [Pinibacter soli]MDI3318600.1 hypothetical protein [Pinibacter soli]